MPEIMETITITEAQHKALLAVGAPIDDAIKQPDGSWTFEMPSSVVAMVKEKYPNDDLIAKLIELSEGFEAHMAEKEAKNIKRAATALRHWLSLISTPSHVVLAAFEAHGDNYSGEKAVMIVAGDGFRHHLQVIASLASSMLDKKEMLDEGMAPEIEKINAIARRFLSEEGIKMPKPLFEAVDWRERKDTDQ